MARVHQNAHITLNLTGENQPIWRNSLHEKFPVTPKIYPQSAKHKQAITFFYCIFTLLRSSLVNLSLKRHIRS